jgi:hypothetical protein
LKNLEKVAELETDSTYVVEGGPGEFMLFITSKADTLSEAIKQAKEDKVEFGFKLIQVRETKTDNIVYKG